MSTAKNKCPKCGGEMTQGFVVDESHGGQRLISNWIEGAPEKRFFFGGVKAPADKRLPVGVFRCSKCGYLESFARSEFAAT